MLSTKKQEEDKDDILDISEFFEKEENKKDALPEEKSKEKSSNSSPGKIINDL